MVVRTGLISTRWRIRSLGLAAVVLFMTGCGSSVGDLSGLVTYQKKPLPHGWIRLVGSDGVLRSARIQADGSYSFGTVPVGDAKLTASCVDPRIYRFARSLLEKSRPDNGDADAIADGSDVDPLARFYLIPRKYEDVTKSNLSFCIESGSNTYDIELH
jgi:hypothetical protein